LSRKETKLTPSGLAIGTVTAARGGTAQLFVSNIFDTKDNFAGSITRLDVMLSPSGISVMKMITR
jgi:hypothetical protein